MTNQTLLILGMHRSGTSLTAQWLHACGLHLGDRLMGVGLGNVRGHYEDLDFHDIHLEVFKTNNTSSGGLWHIPKLELSNYQFSKIEHLVLLKNHLYNQWGWKEPRTCLFLDVYRKVIPTAKNLIVYRDIEEVVDSLLRRRVKEHFDSLRNSGIRGKLKARINKNKIKEGIIKADKSSFIDAWIIYNSKIIEHIEKIEKKDFFLTTYKDFDLCQGELFGWLESVGFELEKIPFNKIYDKKLMNEKSSLISQDDFTTVQAQQIKVINEKIMKYKSH